MTVKTTSLLFSSKVDTHAPMVVGGKGNHIYIEDPVTHKKREIFDAMGGAAVVSLGHGDEDIAAEIAAAAKECSYSYCASMTNYYAEKLAQFLISKSPRDAFAAALFTCSGSESNENGIKTVRQYYLEKGQPERTVFISRKQSYHGYTTGCLALSESMRKEPFRAVCMPDAQFPKVSPCYPYRDKKNDETLAQYCDRLLQEIEDTVLAAGPNKVAAILCETLTGSTFGTSPAIPGYLAGIRRICDKYDIVMWLDEVMCGTGRSSATGGLHCWESFPDFEGPDLQSVGKTLGGGFVTIAGLLVSPKIHNAFVEGSNYISGGQTYHQHAFNCRVALAVQEKVDRLNLRKNSYDKGELLGRRLKERAGETQTIGDVRGLGGFWSIELVKDKITKEPFDMQVGLGAKVSAACLANGMTTMGFGGTVKAVRGDHVSVAPTFTLCDDDVEFIVDTLIKSVKEAEYELHQDGYL
ncbi:PLP-dependent transferase [Metschnikowia bicuspidata var. bicuspidata NRRL YB-4993]|uniref:PLP-dependent transferase n=1 Tax=Metschnikowia bicuspidata var. bicuspidata NRRL YB-4993 TaxID=869754 RepID=A0A1A0H8F6_9ASCO|nr:PLP-dependent transferase [Metschnikowia bicuspidata var. bicuspidata NRRL YB-4993]OBA20306.1 PLP-dependent transferase [Metschnikowia bicuspidata var. bicuspidata NRRL YB-4993]